MLLSDAAYLAWSILSEHGLVELGWRFEFDRSVRRFGMCSHRTQKITMSRALTLRNPMEEVRDTILHEVAHALVGRGHGHDAAWRIMARRLGARPQRCYSAAQVVGVPHKWVAECPVCHGIFRRHRRPSGNRWCGRCGSKIHHYQPGTALVWTARDASAA